PFALLRRAPPTSSTLLPYTTLFRSPRPCPARDRPPGPAARRRRAPVAGADGRAQPDLAAVVALGSGGGQGAAGAHAPRARTAALDRKSTRLNSSHVAISYAVFCLKK